MVEPKKVQVVKVEIGISIAKKIGVTIYVFLVVYSFLLFDNRAIVI